MRSKLWHWEYFQTRPSSSPNENDFYGNNPPHRNAWCRACIAAYIEATSQKDTEDLARGVVSNTRSPDELLLRAFANVHPVSGRREGFEPHIRNCKRISPAAKFRLARERTRPRGRLSSRPSSTTQDSRTNQSSVYPARNLLSNGQQAVFESHLCKLWVANGLGWRAIDSPETHLFFQKWFPGATLPDSQQLSGSILQGELDATYSSIRDEISGRVVTGMTDGWKDVKRNPLMASMLSANSTTYTFKAHNISTKCKTVDNHLNFVLSDIDYAEEELNARVIAWVSDASSSSRSMRERLRRLRPNILTFDSWADQIDLVVGDILSQRNDLVDVADSAIGVIRWIFHHPHLLDRLNEEPAQGDKNFRTLTLPTSARWISHFLSLRSLLFKSKRLRSLVVSSPEVFRVGPGGPPEEIAGATTVLSHIKDPVFWNQLMELALNLEPLAISANVSQASATRLDHIVVELGRLYHVFLNLGSNPKIRKIVLASLERLWAKADQGPYILAIFLNPFIRGELFSQGNTLINSSVLYGILERTFQRVFGREPDLELYEAFHYYYSYQDEFSPHRWHYRELQALAERERKPLDMVRIWNTLLGYQTPNSGRFQLVHLAMHIFSIVPNSDDRGRLFIHAKRQSRRIDQKELDAVVLRMNLKRKHTAEGETRPLKRPFGSSAVDPITSVAHQPDDFGEANTDINWADDDAVPTMRSLATQLYQDVVEDDDLEASDPTRVSIPLRDLFDYTSSDWGEGQGLNIFKPDGLANLEKEFERNALVTQEMQKEFELENTTGQF